MDQGILKNIFMNHVSQIPENFPEKLIYLLKTEKQIDISFETIPPLFQTDGSVVSADHHVYIKYNKDHLFLNKNQNGK